MCVFLPCTNILKHFISAFINLKNTKQHQPTQVTQARGSYMYSNCTYLRL